jgi:integrase
VTPTKRSSERDEHSAKRLFPFLTGRELAQLSKADIRGYIASRQAEGVGAGTINRELGMLSSALNWARDELDWEVPNPVRGRRLREPEGRVRWITRGEAAALLQAARTEPRAPWLADFIQLGLYTGMRSGEMLGLKWRRVDLQAELIYLEAEQHHQKNGKRGSVPINATAREALLARARFRAIHCPASPWVFCESAGERIAAIKKSFRTACRRAGIENFTPHDLRHTCAAWLVQAGVPLAEIRDLLRHSTVEMTERYAHLAPANVAAAVRVLDGAARSQQKITVADLGQDAGRNEAASS